MDALTAAVRDEFLVEIKRLDAENARLRDALEQIIDRVWDCKPDITWIAEIASKALNGEE